MRHFYPRGRRDFFTLLINAMYCVRETTWSSAQLTVHSAPIAARVKAKVTSHINSYNLLAKNRALKNCCGAN